MPGMLSQGAAAPEDEMMTQEAPMDPAVQSAPQPTQTTEPTQPTEGDGAATEDEVSPKAMELLDAAVQDVYSEEQLPRLKKLFQAGGLEGFPQSMGVAVVGALSKLNLDGVDDNVLAEVGVKLFEMLTEDIIESGEVEGVTPPILMDAVKTTLQMAAEKFPDRVNMDEFAAAWQQEVAAEGGEMAPEQGAMQPGAPAPTAAQPAAPTQGILSGGM